jgi:predicted negative regulator of RcsB-dependent stress response
MNYSEAVQTLLNAESASHFWLVCIALAVLLLLACQTFKTVRELFFQPGREAAEAYGTHCEQSEQRFQRDERHIAENRDDIRDLKEGLRVSCVANMALLNHAIHNGNTAEMQRASDQLNQYLINRK